MIYSTVATQIEIVTVEDDELDIADWIDEIQSSKGSKRSMTLR